MRRSKPSIASPGLTPGRLALDHQRAQPLRGAVKRCRQAGRPTSDDRGVIFGKSWGRLQAEEAREFARSRLPYHRPVGEQHLAIIVMWPYIGPTRRQLGRIGGQPVVCDLVTREEPAQLAAGSIPALPDDDHARFRRFSGGLGLQLRCLGHIRTSGRRFVCAARAGPAG